MRRNGVASLLAVVALLVPAVPRSGAAAPGPLVIAVDTSRSLSGRELRQATDLVASSLDRLPPETRLGLIGFDDESRWAAPIGTPKEEVGSALASLTPGGHWTVLDDALAIALQAMPDGGVVLLVSDGRDERSATTVDDVARLAEAHRVAIVAVAVGRRPNERALRRLALLSRGAVLGPSAGLSGAAIGAAIRAARESWPATAAPPTPPPRSVAAAPAAGRAPPATAPPALPAEPSRRFPAWLAAVLAAALLIAVVTVVAALRRRQETPRRFCPRCGSELPPGTADCPRCNEDLRRQRLLALPVTPAGDTRTASPNATGVVPQLGAGASFEHTFVLEEKAVLRVEAPAEEPQSYLLDSERAFAVGRDPARNSLALPDPSLSSTHFRLVPDGGALVLLDLDSTNGTFVNDERVAVRELRPGDSIRAGRTRFGYQLEQRRLN